MRIKKLEDLELNQENVLQLYKQCLVPKQNIGIEPKNELRIKIFTVESCGKDSPEFVFNKNVIDDNIDIIEHYLGQLKIAHENFKEFTLPMGFINYKNEPWTKDNGTLMALYYLAVASKIIPVFTKLPDCDKIASSSESISPALSPNDPGFKLLYDVTERVE